jgi:hypothetical protein
MGESADIPDDLCACADHHGCDLIILGRHGEWWCVVSSLRWRSWMPSVVGLLEQRELAARRRVDELREEADRIQAELAVAERDWQEWVITRSRVGEVLARRLCLWYCVLSPSDPGHIETGRASVTRLTPSGRS